MRPALRALLAAALLAPGLLTEASARVATRADPGALLDDLEGAWSARDVEAYLALWSFPTAEARSEEQEFARSQFSAGESRLLLQRPASISAGAKGLALNAQIFSVSEPRAAVSQWLLRLEKGSAGWELAGREPRDRIDGLVHLSLDPEGYRADGLSLHLEDFDLDMVRGTLFTPPQAVGPTALVFVGEGTVRFSPRPATEQEQLRQFCGRPALVDEVRAVFLRIHPANLHHVLAPVRLERDPEARRRLEPARRFYARHATGSFVLDSPLPGSPWWILPGLGDALASFQTAHNGTLTYTLNAGDAEGISLFDRGKRRQICLYPAGGGGTRYSEDDGRGQDVVHHDLSVRFDPARKALAGEDTMRIRLLAPSLTLRLRLDEALSVESITSPEGGSHLFFRVRHQDSLLVSLGPLSGSAGELSLTVRYAGVLAPPPVEHEVSERLQAIPPSGGIGGNARSPDEDIRIEDVLVFTNLKAWYPQAGTDDHATFTLRFDVPAGYTAVTGGVRTAARTEGLRSVVEYRLDQPGKYISVAVGRLLEAGARQEGPVSLRAFSVGRARSTAATALERAVEILRFYAEEFGPCPYPSLNLVVIEGRTPGGHAPPGMVILAQRPLLMWGTLREDPGSVSDVPGFFLAHELAHQWWGQGVAGQNYHERWLSEGAAQYSAALWVRQSRGEEAFRATLKRMARWALQDSREGPISLGHRLGHLKEDPQIYRAVVYDKGAYVLHMLRAIAGDEAFREALRTLQAEHRYGKLGTDDLREALEAAAGRDLSAYFRAWVFGTSLPTLRLSQRSEPGSAGGHKVLVQVRAQNLPGPVPLELSVTHEQGREDKRVILGPEGGTWTIETPSRPRKVQANDDYGLLASIVKG